MKKILLSVTAITMMSTYAVAGGSLVKSKVPVLKFSGKHYLGFISNSDKDLNKFETRRNYLQVKAYFEEDPKSYFRITLDTHDKEGETGVRLKYAYLYLDNILLNTGVEIGQAHRPWIDYEEHGGWNYRSISKVFTEAHDGAHLTNSADRGINFKTKLDNYSSELGLYNGEGYHNEQIDDKLSFEWRLTYHALGGGEHKPKAKNTYANISFLGQQNSKSHKHKDEDLNWVGVHAVYNQPKFLVAGQYITTNDAHPKYAGEGYSLNGEYRFMPKWNLIARYDSFEMDKDALEKTRTIAGVAHKYNKNVEFIANVLKEEVGNDDETTLMLTAEINW